MYRFLTIIFLKVHYHTYYYYVFIKFLQNPNINKVLTVRFL